MATQARRMKQRSDTAANWTAANPILLRGEIGHESNTGKFKIGDGVTAWNSLDYFGGDVAASLAAIRNGVAAEGDDLAKLLMKINAISAIIGGATPDGDSVVDVVTELLSVFQTYPEGIDIFTSLNGKINNTAIVNNLEQIAAGTVLDGRQGKILKDLIEAVGGASAGLATMSATDLATAGLGTDASPFTGWGAEVESYLESLAGKGNATINFPSGIYLRDPSFNWSKYANVLYRADAGTIIRALDDDGAVMDLRGERVNIESSDTQTTNNVFNITLENFTLDGGGVASQGLLMQAVHHCRLVNIGIRNVTAEGMRLGFSVLNRFEHLRISGRVGDQDGVGFADSMPVVGIMVTGQDVNGVGGVAQANQFVNFIVEKCLGDGIVLAQANQNKFEGGTSEDNGGINLVVQATCADNHFDTCDFEFSHSHMDVHCSGNQNIFQNIWTDDDLYIHGGLKNRIIGGRPNIVRISKDAISTQVFSPTLSAQRYSDGLINQSPTTEFFGSPYDARLNSDTSWGVKTPKGAEFGGDVIVTDAAKGVLFRKPNGVFVRQTIGADNQPVYTALPYSAPLAFGSDLIIDLAAEDVTVADGLPIEKIYNRGVGGHFIETNPVNFPIREDVGGEKTVKHDGTNDRLFSKLSIPSFDNVTVYMVVRSNDASARHVLAIGSSGTAITKHYTSGKWRVGATEIGNISGDFDLVKYTGSTAVGAWTIGAAHTGSGADNANISWKRIVAVCRTLTADETDALEEYLLTYATAPEPPEEFIPEDITSSSLVIRGSAQAGANNDPQASLVDLSGLSNAPVQATGADQALLKTGAISGKSSLLFDGTDSYTSPVAINAQPISIWALVKPAAISGTQTLLSSSNSSGGLLIQVTSDGQVNVQKKDVAEIGLSSGVTVLQAGVWALVRVSIAANGDWVIGVNNTLATGNTDQTFGAAQTTSIAQRGNGSNYFTGEIAEVNIFSAILTSGENASMKAYYNAEYGLSLS